MRTKLYKYIATIIFALISIFNLSAADPVLWLDGKSINCNTFGYMTAIKEIYYFEDGDLASADNIGLATNITGNGSISKESSLEWGWECDQEGLLSLAYDSNKWKFKRTGTGNGTAYVTFYLKSDSEVRSTTTLQVNLTSEGSEFQGFSFTIGGSAVESNYDYTWGGVDIESFTVVATSIPNTYTNNTSLFSYSWSSTNPDVAYINPSTGKVNVKKAGVATITATADSDKYSLNGAVVSSSFTLTVTTDGANPDELSGGTISTQEMQISNFGSSEALPTITYTPDGGGDSQDITGNGSITLAEDLLWDYETTPENMVELVCESGIWKFKRVGTSSDVSIKYYLKSDETVSYDSTLNLGENPLTKFTLAAGGDDSIEESGYEIDRYTSSSLAVSIASTNPTEYAANSSYMDLDWDTSDSSIATVSKGVVSLHKRGEATIKATAGERYTGGAGVESSFVLTVTELSSGTAPTSLKMNIPYGSVVLGSSIYPTLQLDIAQITPSTASKQVGWVSSNNEIATVDDSGLVTPVAVGSATITATSVYTPIVFTQCVVTVVDTDPAKYIGIAFTNADGVVQTSRSQNNVNGQSKFGIIFSTSKSQFDTDNTELSSSYTGWTSDRVSLMDWTWRSDDESIVIPNLDGANWKTKRTGSGATYLHFMYKYDPSVCYSLYCDNTLTGVPTVGRITIPSGQVLSVDYSRQLVYSLDVTGANLDAFTWTSSNEDVLKIEPGGVISGISVGESTVTIKDTASGISTSSVVKVVDFAYIENINFSEDGGLSLGEERVLNYTINPWYAAIPVLCWYSDNPDVISVDEYSGVIKANAVGESTITATAQDGSLVTSSVKLSVSVTENYASLQVPSYLKVGDVIQLAVLNPQKEVNSVTWTQNGAQLSSNEVSVNSGETKFVGTVSYKDGTSEVIVKYFVVE